MTLDIASHFWRNVSKPWRSEKVRRTRGEAQKFVDVLEYEMPEDVEYVIGGSWRRNAPDIGDLDVMVVTKSGTMEGVKLPESFVAQRHGNRIVQGDLRYLSDEQLLKADLLKSSLTMHVDFWSCAPKAKGAFLCFITGPKALNVIQRAGAIKIGYKLTQDGLFMPDGYQVDNGTEQDVYRRLGLVWIPPEERQQFVEAPPPKDEPERVVEVPSDSNPNKPHKVRIKGKSARCDSWCLAFKYSREIPPTCKHIRTARKILAAST
jgi:DNA polymerase/3'-5' exonuclease PolX